MRTLRPLAGDDPRLRGIGSGLRWWRLDVDGGRAAADAISGCVAGAGAWNARLQGSAEALGYAAAIVGREATRGAVLRLDGLDGGAAASLVDTATASSLTVSLERAPSPAEAAFAAVVVEGGARWAALAAPVAAEAARLARSVGAELVAAESARLPERVAPAGRGAARRTGRRTRILAGSLVVIVAAAATGVGLWLRDRAPSRGAASAQTPGPVNANAAAAPRTAPPQPEATFGSAIVDDPPRDEVLMLGGVNGYEDTWAWRPAFHWVLQHPAVAPPGRFGAAAAYDAQAGTVVVFGGRARTGELLSDTWIWDGNWSRAGTAPGARSGPPGGEFPAMAYDPLHDQVVLVTRVAGGPSQTWLLGPESAWGLQPAAGVLPDPRAMAWDAVSKQLLLVTAGSRPDRSQTWSWTGGRWVALGDMPVSILATPAAMATDPQTGHAVLVAGDSGTPSGSAPVWRTWVWDGRSWRDAAPPPDAVAGLASDVVDGELLAFTQSGGDTTLPVRDAWAWSGKAWIQLY